MIRGVRQRKGLVRNGLQGITPREKSTPEEGIMYVWNDKTP